MAQVRLLFHTLECFDPVFDKPDGRSPGPPSPPILGGTNLKVPQDWGNPSMPTWDIRIISERGAWTIFSFLASSLLNHMPRRKQSQGFIFRPLYLFTQNLVRGHGHTTLLEQLLNKATFLGADNVGGAFF